MKKICVVLVTYNRINLLKECVNHLCENMGVKHIVIVNNNSTDGTEKYLNQLDNTIFIIQNSKENLGGAGGFSLGMKIAYEKTDDDYFWLMDDDTIPEEDASVSLLEKARALNDKFGFLCSNVRWTDGTACNIPYTVQKWPQRVNEGLIQVSQATFVSVLFTREVVGKVGVPTKEMFIWGDDTEYTVRVSQVYASYFVIDSLVIHKTTNNLSGITILNDSSDRIKRYFYLNRNLIYISRLYKGQKATNKLFLHHMIYAIKVLLFSKNHHLQRFNSIVYGTFKGMFFNPKILFPNK